MKKKLMKTSRKGKVGSWSTPCVWGRGKVDQASSCGGGKKNGPFSNIIGKDAWTWFCHVQTGGEGCD